MAGFFVAFACSAVIACVGEDITPIPGPGPEGPPLRGPSSDGSPLADEDAPASRDAVAPPSRLPQPCGAGGTACEGASESCCKTKTGIGCAILPSSCTAGGGAVLDCTKSADCTAAGKAKCCAALVVPKGTCAEPVLQGGSACRSSCLATETELCAGTAFDCPAAKPTCLGATVQVGADALRIGRCVAETP